MDWYRLRIFWLRGATNIFGRNPIPFACPAPSTLGVASSFWLCRTPSAALWANRMCATGVLLLSPVKEGARSTNPKQIRQWNPLINLFQIWDTDWACVMSGSRGTSRGRRQPITTDTIRTMDNSFLKCSICQEFMEDPKCLDCLHNFCARCLDGYLKGEVLVTQAHSVRVWGPALVQLRLCLKHISDISAAR